MDKDLTKFNSALSLQASQAGFGMSVSQQLCLSFQQSQYEKRLKVLTKPVDAAERKTAFEKMSESVDNAFTEALTTLACQVTLRDSMCYRPPTTKGKSSSS